MTVKQAIIIFFLANYATFFRRLRKFHCQNRSNRGVESLIIYRLFYLKMAKRQATQHGGISVEGFRSVFDYRAEIKPLRHLGHYCKFHRTELGKIFRYIDPLYLQINRYLAVY